MDNIEEATIVEEEKITTIVSEFGTIRTYDADGLLHNVPGKPAVITRNGFQFFNHGKLHSDGVCPSDVRYKSECSREEMEDPEFMFNPSNWDEASWHSNRVVSRENNNPAVIRFRDQYYIEEWYNDGIRIPLIAGEPYDTITFCLQNGFKFSRNGIGSSEEKLSKDFFESRLSKIFEGKLLPTYMDFENHRSRVFFIDPTSRDYHHDEDVPAYLSTDKIIYYKYGDRKRYDVNLLTSHLFNSRGEELLVWSRERKNGPSTMKGGKMQWGDSIS